MTRALWDRLCQPVRQPLQWLLGRAHHCLSGVMPFAYLGAFAYFGYYRPHWAWAFLVIQGSISLALFLAGSAAHVLWERGRIWQDTICPACDHPGGGGGGWFDLPDPPDNPDDHGLTAPGHRTTPLPRPATTT
ncbi:hypothetical protein [Streptomyces pakalii]|uniref:Fatty acid desaturase n=1 Tax=Streptomyces pakalii TaxID=3036494 RepID=A0ABT7DH72_9ACTN|nr:hypothetical protein [Streptomyces pakalii]MDJ1645176.1 hypothetical protein [Streptomyces pakalii]